MQLLLFHIGLHHNLITINRFTRNIMSVDPSFTGFMLQEELRIEALTDREVQLELHNIMDGRSYSWHCINNLMMAQLYSGDLEFTYQDGDAIFEWNNLCDEKRHWEREGSLSCDSAEFNRDCLFNLKILPTKAGLGSEGDQ